MFERPRQVVHSAKDRELAWPRPVVLDRVDDRLDDPVRLVMTVVVYPHDDGIPLVVLGKQPLRLAASVVPDQPVGDPQNVWRAAVILLQTNRMNRRVILFEIENVVQVGAPPPVDRLVRVAGDGQVRVVDRQRPHDRVLRQIRVLVLVDHDVPESGVELATDLRVFPEQHRDVQQQVVEVDRVGRQQLLAIHRIDAGGDRFFGGQRHPFQH